MSALQQGEGARTPHEQFALARLLLLPSQTELLGHTGLCPRSRCAGSCRAACGCRMIPCGAPVWGCDAHGEEAPRETLSGWCSAPSAKSLWPQSCEGGWMQSYPCTAQIQAAPLPGSPCTRCSRHQPRSPQPCNTPLQTPFLPARPQFCSCLALSLPLTLLQPPPGAGSPHGAPAWGTAKVPNSTSVVQCSAERPRRPCCSPGWEPPPAALGCGSRLRALGLGRVGSPAPLGGGARTLVSPPWPWFLSPPGGRAAGARNCRPPAGSYSLGPL